MVIAPPALFNPTLRNTSGLNSRILPVVMPGLVPGIHVFLNFDGSKTWMAGTSPAMTKQASLTDLIRQSMWPLSMDHRVIGERSDAVLPNGYARW